MTRQTTTWTVTAAVVACLVVAAPADAQQPTVGVFQDLAVGCLAEVPDTVYAFHLDAPDAMAYLRTALADRWQRDGRTIFLPDSSLRNTALPRLTYGVEEAGVAYARAGRSRLRRTVTLALRYTLTAADGRLLREDGCRDAFSDTLRNDDRRAVESDAFPETRAEPPRAGWMRRYLEPALLATATAITVYLFFNLRSERVTE